MKDLGYEKGSSEKNVHFAAVNSGYGFLSFYGEVFGNGRITRRYIIKGGPGTGKSSFMKRVAERAEEKGRIVEYYRCSSDPDSLDGIVIDGNTAFLDGTAPHVYEPNIPGAADEIINLGEFWDSDRLYSRYNEIASLSALKTNAYTRAYKFLSAAMNVEEINRSLASPALLRGKMRSAVGRLLRAVPDGDGFEREYGFVNAIGMKGLAHLDTYEREAKKLYVLYDSYGFAADMLSEIVEAAQLKRLRIKASYSPLTPELPDAVLLKDSGIAFVTDESCDSPFRINVKRFVDSDMIDEIKGEYRMNRRLRDALTDSAVGELKRAGEYHFKLEEIYVSCMDFRAEDNFIRSFCDRVIC